MFTTFKGWRSYAVAAAVAVLGVLEVTDFTHLVTGQNAGWWLLGIAVVKAVLRTVTTTPPGKAE